MFNAKPMTASLHSKHSVRSKHSMVRLADGTVEWRHVTCPPGAKEGSPLEVTSNGLRMVVLVPPGVTPGDTFTVRQAARGAPPACTVRARNPCSAVCVGQPVPRMAGVVCVIPVLWDGGAAPARRARVVQDDRGWAPELGRAK